MKPLRVVVPLCAIFVFAFGASTAKAGSGIDVGVFGGLNIPLIQADAESGNIYGVRVAYDVSMLSLQPYVAFSAIGDYDLAGAGSIPTSTLDGGDLTVYGVDATLGGGGTGFGIYLLGGIASYKLEYENGTPITSTNIGYSAGLGFKLNMTSSPLAIDGRAAVAIIPLENGGSRKYFLPTIGVTYNFGGGY